MRSFKDAELHGARVFVRVDFNVPIDDEGKITDDLRIRAALPTLEALLAKGATLIIASHLGRPKGIDPKCSLQPVAARLGELLRKPIHFIDDCIRPDGVEKSKALQAGEVLLLENLRYYKEEEKGDVEFAKKLAALGDVYVNDAFGAAHRAHASTSVMAQFFTDKYAGLLLETEVNNAQKCLDSYQKPYVAILGGSKVSDKIGVIENLLDKVDTLIIVGAMSFTFLKALGKEVGKSRIEADKLDLALSLLEKAKTKGVKVILPTDVYAADTFSEDSPFEVVSADAIPADKMGLDIGADSVAAIKTALSDAKTILWNGPAGVFEFKAFETGTLGLAQAIAIATKNGAYSIVGGGDSAAAVAQFKMESEFSYISTGGGALLEYLEGKILPGVAALEG